TVGVNIARMPNWQEAPLTPFPSSGVILGDVTKKKVVPNNTSRTDVRPGQFTPNQDDLVGGAIQAIAVLPPDPNAPPGAPPDSNTVFVGTVNGGVWKTEDATNPKPHWVPLTDSAPSLSISALAFSPLDRNTLYAGTGDLSSLHLSGQGDGLLV